MIDRALYDLLHSSGDKQLILDEASKRFKADVSKLFRQACKKCFLLTKGFVNHTYADCKKANNPCVLPCPKCGGIHWVTDCSL